MCSADPIEVRDFHTPNSVQLLDNTWELAFLVCSRACDGEIPAYPEWTAMLGLSVHLCEKLSWFNPS